MLYTIQNEQLKVVINDFGAEITSVVFQGKERLWQNENGGWTGHAPIMFPACGSCEVVVNGKLYEHFLHGFARKNTFSVSQQSAQSITFSLASNAQTKQLYPYDFQLRFTYSIDGNALTIKHEAFNPSNEPIFCAFGSHESYQLDGDVNGYVIDFEKEENLDTCLHTPDTGKLTGEIKSFGKQKVFALPADFLQEGRTLIFKDLYSEQVALKTLSGKLCAEINFKGFKNLLFWRPHGAKMICIESWQNLPDKVGEELIEFSQKAGIEQIAPKQTKTAERTIKYY